MDDRLFRNAMGKFATGITVVTTEIDGQPYGMTANAFMSVSLQPRLVLVSIGANAQMHGRIMRSQRYGVSILAEHQQEVSALFAGQSRAETPVTFDRLGDLPVIKEAIAHIACTVVASHEAGDHTLFIGEVTDIRLQDGEPLLFSQGKYRALAARQEDMVT